MVTTTAASNFAALYGGMGTTTSGTGQQLVQQYQQAYQQQQLQAYTWAYEPGAVGLGSWQPPQPEQPPQPSEKYFIDELRSEIDEWLKVA